MCEGPPLFRGTPKSSALPGPMRRRGRAAGRGLFTSRSGAESRSRLARLKTRRRGAAAAGERRASTPSSPRLFRAPAAFTGSGPHRTRWPRGAAGGAASAPLFWRRRRRDRRGGQFCAAQAGQGGGWEEPRDLADLRQCHARRSDPCCSGVVSRPCIPRARPGAFYCRGGGGRGLGRSPPWPTPVANSGSGQLPSLKSCACARPLPSLGIVAGDSPAYRNFSESQRSTCNCKSGLEVGSQKRGESVL